MSETTAQANARAACLNCGESGGRTFDLPDGRRVRACEACLRGPCVEWLNGSREVTPYEDDIPLDLARAAHSGTSHVPEERGAQERATYAKTLAADRAKFEEWAGGDPAKLAALESEFERYRAGFCKRFLAHLSARSRCLSTMVTGGSNFPVRRAEKASDSADKRLAELLEFRSRSLAAIRRVLRPEEAPIMSGDEDAVERLRAKIEDAERHQERMKLVNATIRKHVKGGTDAQVAALVALGNIGEAAAREMIRPDFMGRIGFADYETRNNAANIRRMRERLAGLEVAKATPATETEGTSGIRVEDSPAENGVRLFYPGKPAPEVRARLKASGFRWAPTLGCWQGYRNPGTLEVARKEAGAP